MRDYRLYFLGAKEHIIGGEWITAPDDAGALEVARARRGTDPCEVWDGARKVGRVEPVLAAAESRI